MTTGSNKNGKSSYARMHGVRSETTLHVNGLPVCSNCDMPAVNNA
jgi:hypothetical protein